jgi:hypothetical protein
VRRVARDWCRASREEFVENIAWRIKFHLHGTNVIEYYGMKDGSVVYFGQLYYTPDTWCSVHDFDQKMLEKILEDVESAKVIYVSGNIPKELSERLPSRVSVIKVSLPSV